MLKKIKENKTVIVEIIEIIFSLLLVLLCLLKDFNKIETSEFFLSKIENIEDLFFTLFTVQASIAVVGIAIISVITGLFNEYILGISVSSYIVNLKPRILKHNTLIVVSLILVVINYFCLHFSFFNLCLGLFIISVFIIINLANKIFIIFSGKNKVKKEIEDYILRNYNRDALLDNLSVQLISSIETGNSLIVNENLAAIKSIFEKELNKYSYQSTTVLSRLSSVISEAFDKIIQKHNAQKTNDIIIYICEIYKLANKNEKYPYHLNIWQSIDNNFFRAIKDLNYEQIIDDGAIFSLHNELYKNLKGREIEQVEGSNLKYYSSWLYLLLINRNSKLEEMEKKRIKKDIYEILNSLVLFYGKYNHDEEILIKLRLMELCNLHKIMIDNGDISGINKLFFNHFRFGMNDDKHLVILFVTMIYLYYLSSRESLVDKNEVQEYAKKILEMNHDKIVYFYLSIDIDTFLTTWLPLVRKILHNWEYMEEDTAKWVIIDQVIDDFFIFVALDKFWEKKRINNTVDLIAPNTIFPLYNRYFSSNNGINVKKLYSDFEKIINKEKDEKILDGKISILNDIFNEHYKSEIIREGEDNKITQEKESRFSKNIVDFITQTNKKIFSQFSLKIENNVSGVCISTKRATICKIVLNKYFFNEENLNKSISDYIFNGMIVTFLNSIRNNIEYKKVSNKEKRKQMLIIDLIKEFSLSPTVAIGNRDNFWDEEPTNRLNEYTKNMFRIKFPSGYNCYYLIDSSLIGFSMKNIEVKFEDLTWEEIESKCKIMENGELSYKVTNDIYIPFSKDEIKQYIFNTEKCMVIYADIDVYLGKEKIGAGIGISIS